MGARPRSGTLPNGPPRSGVSPGMDARSPCPRTGAKSHARSENRRYASHETDQQPTCVTHNARYFGLGKTGSWRRTGGTYWQDAILRYSARNRFRGTRTFIDSIRRSVVVGAVLRVDDGRRPALLSPDAATPTPGALRQNSSPGEARTPYHAPGPWRSQGLVGGGTRRSFDRWHRSRGGGGPAQRRPRVLPTRSGRDRRRRAVDVR